MKKKTTYNGIEIEVSNKGQIFIDGKEMPTTSIGPSGKYMYVQVWDKDKKKAKLISVSRAVCKAFHPLPEGEDYSMYQADHIDCDTHNNKASNLRWMTRKQNNTREHASKLRSETIRKRLSNGGWHKVRHDNQVIKATSIADGTVRIFKTGITAAKALGCSHVLIYRVLSPNDYPKTAKGHTLEWLDIKDMEEIA